MDEKTKSKWRKRAQRSVPLVECESCGSTSSLQRHHPDWETPEVVRVMCQMCHTKVDYDRGRWGRGRKKRKQCVVCQSSFLPSHSKKHKTCSPQCLSILGRFNAGLRWGKELTDLDHLETP